MDLNNKKLFIFDLDGTLVDTAPDFKNSLNYMLTEMNEPTVELEEIRNLVGYGARELIKRTAISKGINHNDQKINEMLRIFLLHYTHNIDDDSVLFENVKNVKRVPLPKGTKSVIIDPDETLPDGNRPNNATSKPLAFTWVFDNPKYLEILFTITFALIIYLRWIFVTQHPSYLLKLTLSNPGS